MRIRLLVQHWPGAAALGLLLPAIACGQAAGYNHIIAHAKASLSAGSGGQAPAHRSNAAQSPSLEETMKFIASHSTVRTIIYGSNVIETYAIASPDACTLTWSYLYVLSQTEITRTDAVAHLTAVDLNSIVPDGDKVDLSTAPGENGIETSSIDYQSPHVMDLDTPRLSSNMPAFNAKLETEIAAAKQNPCNPGDKGCTVSQGTGSAPLWVGNPGMAQRVARALKHAALLCGAQSPTPF